MSIQWTIAAVVGAWMLVCLSITRASGQSGGHASSQPDRTTWRQKQFMVTFWCPPPASDEALARVAAEGYNLTWVPVEGLDVAARHKLRAMLTSDLLNATSLDDPARRAALDALIGKVKNHPAMEAYFITDEPGAGAFPGLGKLVAYLRQRDPAHLAYINLFPTYANEQQLGVSADAAERAKVGIPQNFAGVGTSDKTVLRYREHLRQFIATVKPDLISYDHYHFMKDGSDGKQYFLNLALIREASLAAGKPFLNIIQADTIEKSWRLPNAAETRFLVFTTMAYGGRGISYFTYWGPESYGGLYRDGKASPMVKEVAAINAEINRLGPALMELESTAVYHTAPVPYGTQTAPADAPVQVTGGGEFVLGLFGKAKAATETKAPVALKTTAFMIVNRNYKQPGEATLKVRPPVRALQELDRTSGRWIAGPALDPNGQIKVDLAPGDGRLFRVAESGT
ncbi:MAG: hypothetical protein ABFD92_19445 [Planctomycetaceae bacterium]|nr:hypothetical protein [Planctomycetaceae bacterium]